MAAAMAAFNGSVVVTQFGGETYFPVDNSMFSINNDLAGSGDHIRGHHWGGRFSVNFGTVVHRRSSRDGTIEVQPCARHVEFVGEGCVYIFEHDEARDGVQFRGMVRVRSSSSGKGSIIYGEMVAH